MGFEGSDTVFESASHFAHYENQLFKGWITAGKRRILLEGFFDRRWRRDGLGNDARITRHGVGEEEMSGAFTQ